MKNLRNTQLRWVQAPVMVMSLLAACGGHMVGQTTPEDVIREAGNNGKSIRSSAVMDPSLEMLRWTPTMKRPSAADLMTLPTAERLAYKMGDSPAAGEPARTSTSGKIAVVAEGVLTTVAVMADILATSFQSFCPFCSR